MAVAEWSGVERNGEDRIGVAVRDWTGQDRIGLDWRGWDRIGWNGAYFQFTKGGLQWQVSDTLRNCQRICGTATRINELHC